MWHPQQGPTGQLEAASTVSVNQQLEQLAGPGGGHGAQIALTISDSVKNIQKPPTE